MNNRIIPQMTNCRHNENIKAHNITIPNKDVAIYLTHD